MGRPHAHAKEPASCRGEELNYISFAMFGWSLYYILLGRRVLQNGRVVQIYRMHCQFAWHGAANFLSFFLFFLIKNGNAHCPMRPILGVFGNSTFFITFMLDLVKLFHYCLLFALSLIICLHPIDYWFLSFSLSLLCFVYVCVCLSVCQSLYLFYFLLPPPHHKCYFLSPNA